jgi:DNA-binding HxlR family transcriptional regulator
VGEPVNDKVFMETLRRMESDGLVERVVLNGAPPAVLYRLTADGRAVLECLASLMDWYRRRTSAGGEADGG